jgi:hypothetical protein
MRLIRGEYNLRARHYVTPLRTVYRTMIVSPASVRTRADSLSG